MGAPVPPGVLGVSLLFWGFLTGHLILGIGLALAVEMSLVIRARWEISEELLTRIWTLSGVGFLFTPAFAVYQGEGSQMIYRVLEWLPVILVPCVLSQRYSTWKGIPTTVLSIVSKRSRSERVRSGEDPGPVLLVNMEYFFLLSTVCAASASNPKGLTYFVGASLLMAIGLWGNPDRPARRWLSFSVCLLLVIGFAFGGGVGLHRLHNYLEARFLGFSNNDTDTDHARTHIGKVGEVKLSPAIVWRLREVQGKAPIYLRMATFNTYRGGNWYTTQLLDPDGERQAPTRVQFGEDVDIMVPAGFSGVKAIPGTDRTVWLLSNAKREGWAGEVELVRMRGSGREEWTVPIADSAWRLTGLATPGVSQNQLGTARAIEPEEGIVKFRMDFEHGLGLALEPQKSVIRDFDREVPTYEHAALSRVTEQLQLHGKSDREIVDRLGHFFRTEFEYSTYQDIAEAELPEGATAIQAFLEQTRRGHCEYFATATVLMLRKMGIPARYVTGFSISEYDSGSKEYVVRGLHAHAWAMAYVDGEWEYVENTPPSWLEEDEHVLSWLQPVADWFAGLPVWFAEYQETDTGAKVVSIGQWATLPLLALWLWWRLFRGQKSRRVATQTDFEGALVRTGLDSDFYGLVGEIEARSERRDLGECLRDWWERVRSRSPEGMREEVDALLILHYRYRFDPQGLMQDERDALRDGASRCLDQLRAIDS